jgi:P27 family predicted phage terminase small subunit
MLMSTPGAIAISKQAIPSTTGEPLRTISQLKTFTTMAKPRKPTAILEATGAFDKHPDRRRGTEPGFEGEASCPRHLDSEARKEWRRIAPQLRRYGLLTAVDRSALAAYCACVSLAIKAQHDIAEHGIVLTGGRKNPACTVLKDALQQVRQFAGEFGMTPSSRSKVAMPSEVHIHSAPLDMSVEDPGEKYFKN